MKKIVGPKITLYSALLLLGIAGVIASAVLNLHIFVIAGLSVITLVFLTLQLLVIIKYFKFYNNLSGAANDGELPELGEKQLKLPAVGNLQMLFNKLKEVINFAKSMGKDEAYEFKYIDPEDQVGASLLELAKQQKEHEQGAHMRHWKTEGLAKFGEIIRTNNHDLETLSLQILSNLVKYVRANQGGFFIADNDDGERFMTLSACFAYDRKKFVEQRIEEGQGLLGQVMLEKDIIYMTDVPADFVRITSGLGEATPGNIIIVPLMVNEDFYGAIELASFSMFQEHEIEFLREVAVNIGSAIAAVKTNENTQNLLEESQSLAAELRSAEEECARTWKSFRLLRRK